MSEWKEYKLDEIADIYNNKRIPLSSIVRSKRQGKYPYYGASGIVDYIDDYIFDGDYILISEDGENLRSRKTPIAFRAQGKFWVNNHAHIIQGKDKFLNNWISYFFKNLNVSPYLTGAVQPKLNKENLLRIPIPIPDFESASIITEILSSLDDKIELNNNINKELEKLAQTLFKQWFIDFEFPDEKGEPYQSSGGEMVESELGMIPKGWEVGDLNLIAEISRKSIKPFEHPNTAYSYYSLPEFDNGKTPSNEFGIKILSSKYQVLNKSILISKLNPRIPRIWTVINCSANSICSTEFQVIKAFDEQYFPFLNCLFRSFPYLNSIQSKVTGTSSSHQRVNPKDIINYEMTLPPIDLVRAFCDLTFNNFVLIDDNRKENIELLNLRDTLLPKLISGELNVKDL